MNDKKLSQPYAYELMRNAKGAIAEMTLAASSKVSTNLAPF